MPSVRSNLHRVPPKQLWVAFELSRLSYFGGGGDLAPPHSTTDVSDMVNDILLMHSPLAPSCERLMDPMLLEAHFMFQRQATEGSTSTARVLSVVTPPLKKLILQFFLEVKQNN
jgi:hypothetical protein